MWLSGAHCIIIVIIIIIMLICNMHWGTREHNPMKHSKQQIV